MPSDEKTPAPAPASLRSYLLGTWELESYVEIAADGSVADRPFGADARGLLIYAPDGFMSAILMPTRRQPFASGDLFSPTPEELAGASRIIAYSGRYRVDEAAESVTHEIALSFFPNWSGHDQVRRAERRPGRLTLTPASPLRSDGRIATPQLIWARPRAT